MSEQYGGFAALYDDFMSGTTDYDGWAAYIDDIFTRYRAAPKLLLDLGCGTGNMSQRFTARGYDVIGLDNSPEMLAIAKAKNPDILFINQDIRAFELYGTVDAVVSLCDVMNYLLTKQDLSRAFSLVHNYLNPEGLFIFDMNTLFKYQKVLGNRTYARQTKSGAFIWDNRYYEKERVNEYRLTFFRKREDRLYERFRERHLQRCFQETLVCGLLEEAGFKLLGLYGEKTFVKPKNNEERAFFVAQKR